MQRSQMITQKMNLRRKFHQNWTMRKCIKNKRNDLGGRGGGVIRY